MPKSKEEWALRFKREANQHLRNLELALELAQTLPAQHAGNGVSQAELDNLYELYRLAHTIKGSGAMVNQPQASQLALQLEQLFSTHFQSATRLNVAQFPTVRTLIAQLQSKLDIIGTEV